nr:hypothetical protein CFP56_62371 [Quercus suber]
MELNQSEGIVRAKRLMKKPKKVLEMNLDDQNGMSRAKTKQQFTPKNGSTVILAKRRLVKTMMLDWIVQFVASLLRSFCFSASEASKALSKNFSSSSKLVPFPPPNSTNGKKKE